MLCNQRPAPTSHPPGVPPLRWAAFAALCAIVLAGTPREGEAGYEFTLYRGEWFSHQSSEATAQAVVVASPAPTVGIDLALSAGGGTIAGRVTRADTATPLGGVVIFAQGQTSGTLSFDRSDADGRYRISGIPADQFLVGTGFLPGAVDDDFVSQYFNQVPLSSQATLVEVAEGQNVAPIDLKLIAGGGISGRVTQDVGGAAIAGCLVVATGVAPTIGFGTTVTDADGFYRLRGLAAGQYTVGFQPVGNARPEFYDDRPDAGSAQRVGVVSDGVTGGIDARLAAGATIAGQVTNAFTHRPIEGALVVVMIPGQFAAASVATDREGHYQVQGLEAGTYHVGVPALGAWWNGQSDQESATALPLTTGAIATGIDIAGVPDGNACTSDPTSGASLGGLITGGGHALAGVEVVLYTTPGLATRAPLPERVRVSAQHTGDDGRFQFDCLPPGAYFARVVPAATTWQSRWFGGADSAQATAIVLGDGERRNDVDFSMDQGGRILGRISAASGSGPIVGITVHALNVATRAEFTALTQADGSYSIESGVTGGLPSGEYKIWTRDFSTANPGLVPVAIRVLSAENTTDGNLIRWELSDQTGFSSLSIDRSEGPAGDRQRLVMIPGPARRTGSYLDRTVRPGSAARYWLVLMDRGGALHQFGPIEAQPAPGAGGISLTLFPNPMQGSITIHYVLAAPAPVDLQILDVTGRHVRTLVSGLQPVGSALASWDGRDDRGQRASAGVYFVRIAAATRVEFRKIVLAR